MKKKLFDDGICDYEYPYFNWIDDPKAVCNLTGKIIEFGEDSGITYGGVHSCNCEGVSDETLAL